MIRNLSVGSIGTDVKVVQDALNYRRRPRDPWLKPDGAFGSHTRAAVVEFQTRSCLAPDGVVGFHTRRALFPLLTFTTYLAVSRTNGKAPSVSAAGASRGFTGGGLKAKGSAGGDVPDPDPSPFLPPLTFPNDPADGPTKTLNLRGFSLPAPSLPESLFGLPQDSAQVQGGAQFQARHLFQNKPGSANPSAAAVLAFQQVYARNKDHEHVEVALGVQLLKPFFAQTSDGLKWGIQPYIQFTWADIFWRRGKFHLVSPFAQITAQTDTQLQDPAFGVGLFPVNISFDVTDRFSINGQGGVVGTWDLAGKRVEAGPQAAIVGAWSF